MPNPLIFGEKSTTLVAADFRSSESAENAAEHVRHELTRGTVNVVPPNDPDLARKMEPEQAGIWRTMIRSHLVFGVAGLLLGLGVAAALLASGAAAAVASPTMTLIFLGMFGAFVGMLVGGLVTLRPDHARVITQVREATRHGRWAVVAHPRSEQEAQAASRVLTGAGGDVIRSI